MPDPTVALPLPLRESRLDCNIRGVRSQSEVRPILRSLRIAIIVRADLEKERIMATLTQTRESGFKTNPDYKILFEPSPRRVRVKINGEIVADSTNSHLLFQTRHLPVYYFPRSDLRLDPMTPTHPHPICPYQGPAASCAIPCRGQ